MAQTPSSAAPDSFGARGSLAVGDATYQIYRINALADRFDVARLPYSIKVVLENLLRHEDGLAVRPADIEAVAGWGNHPERHGFGSEDAAEIALTPERVLMQDFTGVPGVVDLAAMRDALAALGGDPAKVNPLVPVELVIDHSVIAESSGRPESYDENVDIEYQRNIERYQLLRWAQQAFDGFRVVPPGTGICHQVNLEYLSRVVFATDDGQAYCDTLVGTDSHTTMVNGLGVLGWGVGGIEAEAAMLGQPLSLLLPPVVGFRLTGEQPAGTTATDLVLTITHLLRQHGVVGKFVEFYGPGVAAVPLANRATIGNMSPEYGATCAIFPIDEVTLDYLRFTGRDDQHVDLVEAYAKEQGMFHVVGGVEPVYSETIELDLSTVVPSIAGPARPQDLVTLAGAGASYRSALGREPRSGPATLADGSTATVEDGAVVVAAITSCTNTSNPQVMVAAGLVAKRAAERGLTPQAVGQDHPGPRLPGGHGLPRPGRADRAAGRGRLRPGRLRLHHLHRQLRPAAPRGVRGRPRARPVGGVGPVGQPQLRGAHPPRRPDELPGLSPAGGGLRPGRHHGHRPDHRPPRHRRRRAAGAAGRPVAVAGGGHRGHPHLPHLGDVPPAVRRGVRRRRAVAGGGDGHRRHLQLGPRLHLRPPAHLPRGAGHRRRRRSPRWRVPGCWPCWGTA